MSDSDPIFRAVVQGDSAVPDGRALKALGEHIREAAKPQKPSIPTASALPCALLRPSNRKFLRPRTPSR